MNTSSSSIVIFLILFKENELIKLGKLRKLCWLIKMGFLRFPFFGGGAESTYWGVDKNEPKDHLQSKAVLFLLHSIVLV